MSKKIVGATVGTPLSPKKVEEMICPVKTVNGTAPDEKGNVEIDVSGGAGVFVQQDEPVGAPDGSLWVVHPTESKPKGISLYYAGENEADLKNAPNGSVWLAPKGSNKPATPEGGITEETDPTVPDWAKQPQKPPYTAAEVGAATPEDITKALANLPTGGELEGFELIDTIDFSTEEMSKPGAYKKYQVNNVSEIITIWNGMANISENTNSDTNLWLGDSGRFVRASLTGKAAYPTNGYTYVKVLKDCGTLVVESEGALDATNYGRGARALYNLMPVTQPVNSLKIVNNNVESWVANKGTIKLYVR